MARTTTDRMTATEILRFAVVLQTSVPFLIVGVTRGALADEESARPREIREPEVPAAASGSPR